MATQDELHTILSKAAASKTFRDKLTTDPAAAASTLGINLDSSQLIAFQGAAEKLKDSSLDLKVTEKAAKLLAIWI